MNKVVKGLILSCLTVLIITLSFQVKKTYDSYTIVKPKGSTIAIYVEGNNGYEMYNSELLPTSGYLFNASESSCINGATLNYDDNNKTLSIGSISSNTQCSIYFDKEPATLANYIIENVPIVTSGAGLYHHTSDTTASDYVANSAGDDSYRYAGAGGYQSSGSSFDSTTDVVENWLCFGESDGTNCSANSQYRIISVMDDGTIKIIKAKSIGNLKIDDTSNDGVNSSVWENSSLKPNLNGATFLNNSTYMNSTMREMLVPSPAWKIGAVNSAALKAQAFYSQETVSTTTAGGTIAIMNPSDYGFAATSNNWGTNLSLYDGSAYQQDWLYLGVNEWTISPISYSTNSFFTIDPSGKMLASYGCNNSFIALRPVAYLKSGVLYNGGDGSYTNMYTVAYSN